MLQNGRGNRANNVPALYASVPSLVSGECLLYNRCTLVKFCLRSASVIDEIMTKHLYNAGRHSG